MAIRANVTSVEAIEAFRSQLIVYISKARPTLEEVSADVARIRSWLDNDVRIRWQNELKRRLKKLEEAQNELFSAEISNLREASAAERLAVNKAKKAVEEAEEKMRVIKKWDREFNNRVEPLAKQLEKLHSVLSNTLPHGIAYLGETAKTLHAYADIEVGSVEPSTTSRSENSAEKSAEEGAPENPETQ